jgi:type II restriction enzyme
MQLTLPSDITENYKSGSQKIRVMTENWVNRSAYCPNCGYSLRHLPNNSPVADFYCEHCREEYELKSMKGVVGKKIVDGAYTTMIERLTSENNPNFFFLSYNQATLEVKNFLTIPKYFFVPNIIEERKALRPSARRHGWIGCNINMSDIPEFGKIYYIQNGTAINKNIVLEKWNKTGFVRTTHDIDAKGWILDVLLCVEKIGKDEFTLEEVYAFEGYLKAKHPSNNNIQPKIRQQLQFLRDKGLIEFVGRGSYRMKKG